MAFFFLSDSDSCVTYFFLFQAGVPNNLSEATMKSSETLLSKNSWSNVNVSLMSGRLSPHYINPRPRLGPRRVRSSVALLTTKWFLTLPFSFLVRFSGGFSLSVCSLFTFVSPLLLLCFILTLLSSRLSVLPGNVLLCSFLFYPLCIVSLEGEQRISPVTTAYCWSMCAAPSEPSGKSSTV